MTEIPVHVLTLLAAGRTEASAGRPGSGSAGLASQRSRLRCMAKSVQKENISLREGTKNPR